MNILLAVDGSEYTKRMLAYLAAHDELLAKGAQYTAITVVPSIPVHAANFLERGVLDSYYRDEADKILAPIQAFAAQQGWEMKVVKEHGGAAEHIAAYAESHKSDLIIMGSHGHGYLAKAVMGSVASGVMARSERPVLLVR